MSQRILIIIPCYNEESNIGKVLQEIKGLNIGYDIVVIDDGSQDNTYSIASQLSPCLKLVVNIGIGGCVQTGIKYALLYNYDICIQVDGDGQHPPFEIHTLIEDYIKSPASLIIGSRFLLKNRFQSTWMRRIGICAISSAMKWLFGKKITDPTSGFRLMDREAIKLFSCEYPHDFPEPISVGVALEQGLTIREVPVVMRTREYGSSSIAGIKTITYMLRVIGYLILIRMGRHL